MTFQNYKSLSIGNYQLKKLVRVSDGLVLFEKKDEDFTGLCFTAEEDDSTFTFAKSTEEAPTIHLQTSLDGLNWTDYIQGQVYTLYHSGDKVYLRNKESVEQMSTGETDYNQFAMTGKIAASGNIMSLLSPDFKGHLSITGIHCFFRLFRDCISLTTAPELPALTVSQHGYRQMFYGCTSLTTTPELPAQTLAIYSYYQMFRECTSLTEAKPISITTLNKTLCLGQMFYGCSDLQKITILASNSMLAYTQQWVYGVAPSGVFYCKSSFPDTRTSNFIPVGWTRINID